MWFLFMLFAPFCKALHCISVVIFSYCDILCISWRETLLADLFVRYNKKRWKFDKRQFLLYNILHLFFVNKHMKTKIIIAIAISLLSSVPFFVNWMTDIMKETYAAEAVAMQNANECRRATGSYSKFICAIRTRNVKNGAVK